jgi:acetylornithine/succinyldiaminopimelate/putrescine aminotransferase
VGSANQLVAHLKERGILVHQSGPELMRVCTHLDVSAKQIDQACSVFEELLGSRASRNTIL